jgi:acetyl esterase/lipase
MSSDETGNDGRLDPRQLSLLQLIGMATKKKFRAFKDITKTHDELVAIGRKFAESPMQSMIEGKLMKDTSANLSLAPKAGIIRQDGQFKNEIDGNIVNYIFFKPEAVFGVSLLPCVYYIHGGGMQVGTAHYAYYRMWARLLAHQGLAVMLVDFRNALIPGIIGGEHSSGMVSAYPGGLNDCVCGIRWLARNSAQMGIDFARIVVAGESGGGNLSIATLLRLKQTGELHLVHGLYTLCPYILGEWPNKEYPSTIKNQGILLTLDGSGAHAYGAEAFSRRDPCAWPGFVTVEELRGFPKTFVSLNECDPLLDEGLEFYRKCVKAGVSAQCRIVAGTAHAAELMGTMPDITRQTATSLAFFVWGDKARVTIAPDPPKARL